ncbi:MAG TPA: AraC family transcriptional regulator [Chitinophagaceae bacterium]
MIKPLETLSHQSLHWEDQWPPGFKGTGLPGGSRASATGAFGSICIQEFRTSAWTIRFNIFQLIENFIAKLNLDKSGLFIAHQLKGNCQITHNAPFSLRKGQFAGFYSASNSLTAEFTAPFHISFDTFISDDILRETVQFFPAIRSMLENTVIPPTYNNIEGLDIIQSILQCRYPEDMRRHFFEARVKDLLFNYFLVATNKKDSTLLPSAAEETTIEEIKIFINNNLTDHFPIAVLAKKIGMNEQRFKELFKLIIGVGPYEFLLQRRMRKARKMLLRGKSVKEVARYFGYRSSSFTHTFRNYFGYPPSSIPK